MFFVCDLSVYSALCSNDSETPTRTTLIFQEVGVSLSLEEGGAGVLTPVRDVPYERAIEELSRQGIIIKQSTQQL